MTTAFYHDERCLWHSTSGLYSLFLPVGRWVQPMGGGFADSPDSKRRILSLLQVSNLRDRLAFTGAPVARDEELLRVHPASYLERFAAQAEAGGGDLGVSAPFGADSYAIAKVSAGLAIHAVDAVVERRYANAYALCRPAGHHCLPDTPMGFCLLANAAIAVEAAVAKHGLERVMILDWDVHHGNGTQAIFYERADVLTISLHQENCFPPGYSGAGDRGAGAGAGFNINVPLMPGGGHEAYTYAMQRIVVPAAERYRPQLIVVCSGLDANGADPLARMLAYSDTYRYMTGQVMALAERFCDGRLAVIHEGGYAEAVVPFCGAAIVETLCGALSDIVDPTRDFMQAWQPGERFNALQRELIDELAGTLDGR